MVLRSRDGYSEAIGEHLKAAVGTDDIAWACVTGQKLTVYLYGEPLGDPPVGRALVGAFGGMVGVNRNGRGEASSHWYWTAPVTPDG